MLPKSASGLGFRDLRLFNLALLARQGWRLLYNPDNLCARLPKAKYYPNGNLMNTVFTGNASPTWKAVEHGLELLKSGIIWRVGDGNQIRIWRDNWIPRLSSMKVVARPRRPRVRWVRELVSQNYNEWDQDMVRDVFHKIDADEILKIKLPTRRTKDTSMEL